ITSVPSVFHLPCSQHRSPTVKELSLRLPYIRNGDRERAITHATISIRSPALSYTPIVLALVSAGWRSSGVPSLLKRRVRRSGRRTHREKIYNVFKGLRCTLWNQPPLGPSFIRRGS